jgi:integrase
VRVIVAPGQPVGVEVRGPRSRILRDLRAAQAQDRLRAGSARHQTGFVVTTELGEPCDPRNALRALRSAAVRAGLAHAGLHTLRHTAASVMLSRGVPLKVVADLLGHSPIAITGDVYGHVAPDVSLEAVATLGAALTQQHPPRPSNTRTHVGAASCRADRPGARRPHELP